MTGLHGPSRRNAGSALLLLSLLAGPSAAQTDTPPVARHMPAGVVTAATTQEQKSVLLQMQDAFTNIAQTVEPTVVNIKSVRLAGDAGPDDGSGDGPSGPATPKKGSPLTTPGGPGRQPRRSEATGSGVIVRGDGYILTNDHVVEQAVGGDVTVTLFDGREFTGKVFPDYKSDLAIVKIDPGATPLPVASFADSSLVRPGQWAIAVGSPFDLQNTVTVGIISALNRHQTIPTDDGGGRYYPDLIQTDAAINPGNSGGPLFNIDGKVVGINVAIESPVEGSAGVGFAIPVVIAQQIAQTLITQGKITRGYLGLAPDDLTPAIAEEYGQKQGAFVQDVILDSPAGKAGLQAGDIVTAFGGKPITDEITLRQAISAALPGQQVQIAYVRDGKPASATATIAPPPPLPGDTPTALPAATTPKFRLGLGVRNLTATDRQQIGLPADTTGVLVAAVAPGSVAEAAGMNVTYANMIIQKINNTPITNKQDFEQAVGSLTDSSVILIILYKDTGDSQIHQRAVTLRL